MIDDLVCFSHLRWDFVFQRPQHLMTRASRTHRVIYVEEPIVGANEELIHELRGEILVVKPVLREEVRGLEAEAALGRLMTRLWLEMELHRPTVWYCTPLPMLWTEPLEASVVVYDCMDELQAFRYPPAGLKAAETKLLARADVVFTGGRQLYDLKSRRHPSVHCFSSGVDREHYAERRSAPEPLDQASIARPRAGYLGVIDERIDLDLLDTVARGLPDIQFVLLGPTAKVDPRSIPQRSNIWRIDAKPYDALPDYLHGWSCGLMPFARNRATRYISPTKTLEYLAAGLPVVSTPIRDVVDPFGRLGIVDIATTPRMFADAVRTAVSTTPSRARRDRTERILRARSWDGIWRSMIEVLDQVGPGPGDAGRAAPEAPAKALSVEAVRSAAGTVRDR